jgi:oligopeptide/dipeptide ABC transporter ATP-binding protein
LKVENLVKHFPGGPGGSVVHAVNNVSFAIAPGQTIGMVGESGCGKSTIGRAVTRLIKPTSGRIWFEGKDISTLSERHCRPLRTRMQIIFQDPWGALNPRLGVRGLIEEPLRLHTRMTAAERRERTDELATLVRLNTDLLSRFPGELSGGQLQRVCIARAIATNPRLIILDEPTSSLDLSVRAGILNLLAELKHQSGVSMLFISHDLGTLRVICDDILVLYLGSVVEFAPTEAIFDNPAHPYTQALISAHLPADPSIKALRHVLEGETPSPIDLPAGCPFASRCPVAIDPCRRQDQPMVTLEGGVHQARCARIAEGANRILAGATPGQRP